LFKGLVSPNCIVGLILLLKASDVGGIEILKALHSSSSKLDVLLQGITLLNPSDSKPKQSNLFFPNMNAVVLNTLSLGKSFNPNTMAMMEISIMVTTMTSPDLTEQWSKLTIVTIIMFISFLHWGVVEQPSRLLIIVSPFT